VALGLNEFCAAVVYLLVDTDSTVWNVASGKGSLLSRGLQCLRVGYNVCWLRMFTRDEVFLRPQEGKTQMQPMHPTQLNSCLSVYTVHKNVRALPTAALI
jgi:hypothetical protein